VVSDLIQMKALH